MRDTNQKSPEKKLWENFTYFWVYFFQYVVLSFKCLI
jgi:hypothetical protein